MRSEARGPHTSNAEVTRIGDSGLRLSIDGEELSLPFEQFPWFRGAPDTAIRNVERPSSERLRWPDLDIDLAVESIRHPEKFPLISVRS
jgi:hypothetical protein